MYVFNYFTFYYHLNPLLSRIAVSSWLPMFPYLLTRHRSPVPLAQDFSWAPGNRCKLQDLREPSLPMPSLVPSPTRTFRPYLSPSEFQPWQIALCCGWNDNMGTYLWDIPTFWYMQLITQIYIFTSNPPSLHSCSMGWPRSGICRRLGECTSNKYSEPT